MGMPTKQCSICSHKERDAINTALVTPGRSFSAIAAKYGVGINSLYRHYNSCIRALVQEFGELREKLSAKNLLLALETLDAVAWQILHDALADGDRHHALMAVRECRANLQLSAKFGPMQTLQDELQEEKDYGGGDPDDEREPATLKAS